MKPASHGTTVRRDDRGPGAPDALELERLLDRAGVAHRPIHHGAVFVLVPSLRGCSDADAAAVVRRRLGPEDHLATGADGILLIAFAEDAGARANLSCAAIAGDLADLCDAGSLPAIHQVDIGENGLRLRARPLSSMIDEALCSWPIHGVEYPGHAPNSGVAAPSVDFADLDHVFRPIIEVRTKLVSIFQCIPVRPVRGGYVSGERVLDSSDDSGLAALDRASVRAVGAAANALGSGTVRSAFGVTVHFTTLDSSRHRDRFLDACGDHLRRNDMGLVFEIANVPSDATPARVGKLVESLPSGTRRLFVRCSGSSEAIAGFRAPGIHAVGLDVYDATSDEPRTMEQMDEFAAEAKRQQLRSYVVGVRSISLYTASVTCGFDFVGGHAVTPAVRDVGDIQGFRLNLPYLSLFERLGEAGAR